MPMDSWELGKVNELTIPGTGDRTMQRTSGKDRISMDLL